MRSGNRFRTWALAAATVVVCAACERWGTPAPQQPPRIVFAETTYDFAHRRQGVTVTHTFAFRNAGGLDLSIDNVRTSCACTAAVLPARVVPPGGEGTIDAAFDTIDDFGPRTRTITVYSNDPAQPVTTLTLRGDVDVEVAADPAQLYVGHLRRGQTAPNDIRVVVGDPAAVTVGPISASGTVVDSILRDAATRPTEKYVRIAIKPDAPLGRFKEAVVVRTSSARRPLLTIPVTGTVDGDAPRVP